MGKKKRSELCPCGTGQSYEDCCAKFHKRVEAPLTAEKLMRSRYSAYAKRLEQYLVDTWHPAKRPSHIDFEASTKWIELCIIETRLGEAEDSEGWVHFKAKFKENGKANLLEENSFFEKINGAWFYESATNLP